MSMAAAPLQAINGVKKVKPAKGHGSWLRRRVLRQGRSVSGVGPDKDKTVYPGCGQLSLYVPVFFNEETVFLVSTAFFILEAGIAGVDAGLGSHVVGN